MAQVRRERADFSADKTARGKRSRGAACFGSNLLNLPVDPNLYENLRQIETHHWWFAGRRALVRKLLDQFGGKTGGRVLEAGCGTGGNLELLAEFGQLSGFEIEESALAMARERGIGRLEPGHLPDGFPFSGETFDLVVLMDVLEHIEQDVASLQVLRSHMAKDGRLLLTVPALPKMWSHHDTHHHHFRRYTRPHLEQVLRDGGFEPVYLSYYNYFLLPFAWFERKVLARLRPPPDQEEVKLPSAPINALFGMALAMERKMMPAMRYPIGVSLVCVARPRADAHG
jgi:SAM-dependent methyltransferase